MTTDTILLVASQLAAAIVFATDAYYVHLAVRQVTDPAYRSSGRSQVPRIAEKFRKMASCEVIFYLRSTSVLTACFSANALLWFVQAKCQPAPWWRQKIDIVLACSVTLAATMLVLTLRLEARAKRRTPVPL